MRTVNDRRSLAIRMWLQLMVAAVVATAGATHYQLQSRMRAGGGEEALQRLDLLYLREPAPGIRSLGIANESKAVVVFCDGCRLPKVDNAQVIGSSDTALADKYALVTNDGRIGLGYVIIDSRGLVRYRSFDTNPASHAGEISRLVKGVE